MVEDLRAREGVGEVLAVGADGGVEPVGEILLVGDAGEEFLSNEDPSIGDGDGEDHDVVDVAGLDVAVPVEVAAEDQVEGGVVGGELYEEVVKPIEGGVAGDDGEDVDVETGVCSCPDAEHNLDLDTSE